MSAKGTMGGKGWPVFRPKRGLSTARKSRPERGLRRNPCAGNLLARSKRPPAAYKMVGEGQEDNSAFIVKQRRSFLENKNFVLQESRSEEKTEGHPPLEGKG